MRDETLDKLHKTQLELLDVVDTFCKKYSLTYFLIHGTLLGAVRHKGFIPWDDDIDIIMPRKDYDFLIKNLQKEIDDRYFLQTAKTDKYYGRDFAKLRKNNTIFLEKNDAHIKNRHHGVFLDIFVMDSCKQKPNKIKTKIYATINSYIACKRGNISQPLYRNILSILPMNFWISLREMLRKGTGDYTKLIDIGIIAKDKFFPPTSAEFEGKEFLVPGQWDYVLNANYNNYMQLPPVNKRVTHDPVRISFDLSGPDEILD